MPDNAIDRELVKKLFKRFTSQSYQGEIAHSRPRYDAEVAALEEIVPEDAPGQTTLDGLMFRLTHGVSSDLRSHSGGFLTAVVQVLYNRGENDLVIDTTLWEGHPPHIAYFLEGTEDRLLKLTYRGYIGQFGRDADYCDFNFIGGGTTCGTDTNHSIFRLKIPEDQSMHQLGYGGEDNVFYADGKVNIAGAAGHDSTYHLSEQPMWDALDGTHSFKKFKENGNILYIGRGGEYEKIGS